MKQTLQLLVTVAAVLLPASAAANIAPPPRFPAVAAARALEEDLPDATTAELFREVVDAHISDDCRDPFSVRKSLATASRCETEWAIVGRWLDDREELEGLSRSLTRASQSVALVSEVVEVDLWPGRVEVRAEFTLRSEADEAIEILLGAPPALPGFDERVPLLDLQVHIDGAAIEPESRDAVELNSLIALAGGVDVGAEGSQAEIHPLLMDHRGGRWWVWGLALEPGSTRQVTVRYEQSLGADSTAGLALAGPAVISYPLPSGRFWAGEVERAELGVRLHDVPRADVGVIYETLPYRDTGTELRWIFLDFEPCEIPTLLVRRGPTT